MPKNFEPAKEIPDLTNKVALVTGGNAGLGAATVKALAPHNAAAIYLCARRISAAEEVVKQIHEQHPKAQIKILELDLNSFDSVKKCAAKFNEESDRLDILFLNAGVSALNPGKTKEGYESQFGINHMGHALFTQLLMPKMLQTQRQSQDKDVRIVSVSSIAAEGFQPKTGLVLDQMKTDGAAMFTMTRYGHSKFANVLFAKKLAQLYPSITSTSCHPGTVKTEIWGKANGAKWLVRLTAPMVWLTGLTMDNGAKTQLWCATAATGKASAGAVESGKFYFPIGKVKEDLKYLDDQKMTDELWRWTNEELASHGAPGWPEA